MNLNKLNEQIEGSDLYKFMIHHKKVINIIQGLIIIGLLIGINTYVVKDHFIKQQIRDRCGYTTSNFECVCEKNYVEDWKQFKKGNFQINLTNSNMEVPKSIVEFLPTKTQDYINERNSLNKIKELK